MTAVENLARDLCMSDGYNPDDLLCLHEPYIGAGKHIVIHPETLVPSWQLYAHHTRMVLSFVLDHIRDKPADEHAQIIQELLQEVKASEAEPEIEDEPPPRTPNWRDRYALRS